MSRLDKIEKKQEELEDRLNSKTRKKWLNLSPRAKRVFKQEPKKPGYVVVQYLTRKYEVRWILSKVVGGNTIVVDNHAHKLRPQAQWREGKKVWYIVREIDRLPVSNRDYNKVIERGDDTDSDETLIKAVLGAVGVAIRSHFLKTSSNAFIKRVLTF